VKLWIFVSQFAICSSYMQQRHGKYKAHGKADSSKRSFLKTDLVTTSLNIPAPHSLRLNPAGLVLTSLPLRRGDEGSTKSWMFILNIVMAI
jgi:hypothetical protein